jgi:hypothetical protein
MTTAQSGAETPTRFELLNAQDHGQLRLRFPRSTRLHFVQIVVSEFSAAAACCPILFTKDATTGEFYAGAMLGFKAGECLLESAADRGGFEPLNIQREGFFTAGEQIAIDPDHARFGTQGEPLFDEAQQPSAQLRQMQRVLGQLHDGIAKTNAFIRTLLDLKLIESIEVSLNFDDGERITLQGLYTVSMDSLHGLGDAEAVALFRRGDLQRIYAMHTSLGQIAVLATKRNRML